MIKYADRGLVKNGIVNKLFEHLYLAFTLISGIWGLTIGFISYVPTVGSNLKHSLTNVCVDQTKEYGIIKKTRQSWRPRPTTDKVKFSINEKYLIAS